MSIPMNRYGIIGPKQELKRPYEIAPDLFNGRDGGDFYKLARKGQKGWHVSGRVGYVGGSLSLVLPRDKDTPQVITLSPLNSPGEEFEFETGISMKVLREGMLDYRAELLIRRIF